MTSPIDSIFATPKIIMESLEPEVMASTARIQTYRRLAGLRFIDVSGDLLSLQPDGKVTGFLKRSTDVTPLSLDEKSKGLIWGKGGNTDFTPDESTPEDREEAENNIEAVAKMLKALFDLSSLANELVRYNTNTGVFSIVPSDPESSNGDSSDQYFEEDPYLSSHSDRLIDLIQRQEQLSGFPSETDSSSDVFEDAPSFYSESNPNEEEEPLTLDMPGSFDPRARSPSSNGSLSDIMPFVPRPFGGAQERRASDQNGGGSNSFMTLFSRESSPFARFMPSNEVGSDDSRQQSLVRRSEQEMQADRDDPHVRWIEQGTSNDRSPEMIPTVDETKPNSPDAPQEEHEASRNHIANSPSGSSSAEVLRVANDDSSSGEDSEGGVQADAESD